MYAFAISGVVLSALGTLSLLLGYRMYSSGSYDASLGSVYVLCGSFIAAVLNATLGLIATWLVLPKYVDYFSYDFSCFSQKK
jgi:hypothetical protein